jgi:RNA polymerase II-associated protein 1
LSSPGSRPTTPSRAGRKLRFAEIAPSDVHVYESQPSSPKRKALLLPPPTESDKDVVSLGSVRGFDKSQTTARNASQDETGRYLKRTNRIIRL